MYRVLSLFAGIGGFDLGLERTGGFRTRPGVPERAGQWPSGPRSPQIPDADNEDEHAVSIDANALGSAPQYVGAGRWLAEPAVGRVADGIPNRTHRLRALGNAVVPQIPELIGRAILAHEAHQ